jgi:outer membrane receptor protein involved in Fe transport
MPTGNMGPYMQTASTMFKPAANASLTWVKQNHTYKFGGEARWEKYPSVLYYPSYGGYNFSADQTGLPATDGMGLSGTAGFPYASFLLGLIADGNTGVSSAPRLAKSAWSFFAQDTWKVTRKLTLDYGLRWDYQDYFKDMQGRVASFSPTTPNPSAGNLPGAVIYEGSGEGRCNCDFAKVYPFAFGPRLGAAYQITPKTVLRAGVGISYGQTAYESQTSWKVGSNNPYYSPQFGSSAGLLKNGLPTPPSWPIYSAGLYPLAGRLNAPPVAIDHNAGRPPR